MSRKTAGSGGNPYRILYWMGAGVALLLIGVVLLAVFMRPAPRVDADPERTLLWLYDGENKGGPALLAVLEESRSRSSLTAVPFPAPTSARQTFASQGARRATDEVSSYLQRQIHNRLFLPLSVVATLIDAAGGVTVEGRRLGGSQAVEYLRAGGEEYQARRGVQVMLALSEAATQRGVNMSVSQGLALARQVETNMDLTALPQVFERWTAYGAPRVANPGSAGPAELQRLLLPDPEAGGGK